MAKRYKEMQSILDYVLGDSDINPDLGEDDYDASDVDRMQVMLIVIGNTRKSLLSQKIQF